MPKNGTQSTGEILCGLIKKQPPPTLQRFHSLTSWVHKRMQYMCMFFWFSSLLSLSLWLQFCLFAVLFVNVLRPYGLCNKYFRIVSDRSLGKKAMGRRRGRLQGRRRRKGRWDTSPGWPDVAGLDVEHIRYDNIWYLFIVFLPWEVWITSQTYPSFFTLDILIQVKCELLLEKKYRK